MPIGVRQLDEINALLGESPGIIREYESRSPRFLECGDDWLKRAEKILENNRLPIVSRVAHLRGLLVAAGRGVREPSIVLDGRATRRKHAEAVALKALRDAAEAIESAVASRVAQLDEAERVTRQIVAAALAKRIVDPTPNGRSHQQRLEDHRRAIAADPELIPYHVALTALVDKHDVLILIDRALATMESNPVTRS